MQQRRDARQEFQSYKDKMSRLARLSGLTGSRLEKHPIHSHLSSLQEIIESETASLGASLGPYPNNPADILRRNKKFVQAISVYGNDSMYWLQDNYFNELMSDSSLQRFIRTRLPRPELFDSVIAELQQWGYLKSHGLTPRLVQDEGLPDLEFGNNQSLEPYYFEVKTLRQGTSVRSVRRKIEKANQQLKRLPSISSGGCFIRLLGSFIGDNRVGYIPVAVQEVLREIEKVMYSNDCKSVGKTVLTWEQVECIGNIPGWQTWCVTLRSVLVCHKYPRVEFPLPDECMISSTAASHFHIGNENETPVWDIRTQSGDIVAPKRF